MALSSDNSIPPNLSCSNILHKMNKSRKVVPAFVCLSFVKSSSYAVANLPAIVESQTWHSCELQYRFHKQFHLSESE